MAAAFMVQLVLRVKMKTSDVLLRSSSQAAVCTIILDSKALSLASFQNGIPLQSACTPSSPSIGAESCRSGHRLTIPVEPASSSNLDGMPPRSKKLVDFCHTHHKSSRRCRSAQEHMASCDRTYCKYSLDPEKTIYGRHRA